MSRKNDEDELEDMEESSEDQELQPYSSNTALDKTSKSDIMDVNYEDIFMGMIDEHIRGRDREQVIQMEPTSVGLSISESVHDKLEVVGTQEKTTPTGREVSLDDSVFEDDDEEIEGEDKL